MVTRILSAVVLAPLFFVVLFFLPPVFLAVLLACITARASFELLRATKATTMECMSTRRRRPA